MKKFSIDVKASGKKEMKKARKYLRGKGLSVRKRSEAEKLGFGLNYLASYLPLESEPQNDFNYLSGCNSAELILTLPQDWDKLVEIVEEEYVLWNRTSAPIAEAINTAQFCVEHARLRKENEKLKAKIATAQKELSDLQNEH